MYLMFILLWEHIYWVFSFSIFHSMLCYNVVHNYILFILFLFWSNLLVVVIVLFLFLGRRLYKHHTANQVTYYNSTYKKSTSYVLKLNKIRLFDLPSHFLFMLSGRKTYSFSGFIKQQQPLWPLISTYLSPLYSKEWDRATSLLYCLVEC